MLKRLRGVFASMPRCVRRPMWVYLVILIISFGAGIGLNGVRMLWAWRNVNTPPMTPVQRNMWNYGAMSVMATGHLAGLAYLLWSQREVRRGLKQHGRTICPGCTYPLKDVADSGKCPECGDEFGDFQKVEKVWRKWENGG